MTQRRFVGPVAFVIALAACVALVVLHFRDTRVHDLELLCTAGQRVVAQHPRERWLVEFQNAVECSSVIEELLRFGWKDCITDPQIIAALRPRNVMGSRHMYQRLTEIADEVDTRFDCPGLESLLEPP